MRRKGHRRYTEETKRWCDQWSDCWLCGKRGFWPETLDIHHVPGGSARKADWLACLCIACRECHDKEEQYGKGIGAAGWMVLKRARDKTNYSLTRVNEARGWIILTEADVDAAEKKLLEMRQFTWRLW